MEEDKSKKKRYKKKKNNKQSKALDEVSIGGGESVSEDQNPASSEVENVGNGAKDWDVSLSGNSSNGKVAILLESEKQKWLQREAILEETVRQLQVEKDAHIQKGAILLESEKQKWFQREAILEGTVRQLQIEKDSHIQKEATLLDIVNQLRKENNLHLHKEFAFEEAIRQLQAEKNSYFQKEASLEMRIDQLQREKDSWLEKEGQLEEKLSQLVDEKNTLDLKEASLEERIKHLEEDKHSWLLKEDSNKVTIGNQNDDIAVLRAQVVELEESRNKLLHENRELMENISSLQLQIKDIQSTTSSQSSDQLTKLASERDELNSQVDSAFALVERLIEENAELVEKVSELLVELDRHGGSSGRASTTAAEPVSGTSETATFLHQGSKTNGDMPKLSQTIDVVPVKAESNRIHDMNNHLVDVISEPLKSEYTSEIVQVPLEENDVQDLELQDVEIDENDSVPLTDAPLIGAPFRLISFVSRYVSGADLVDKNSLQV